MRIRRAATASAAALDVRLALRQVERGVELADAAFAIDVPSGAVPITIEELRGVRGRCGTPRRDSDMRLTIPRLRQDQPRPPQVGARRPDGYHDLQTVLQTLDLHDTVTIESRRGPFALDGDAALMPLDESNLVWRAAAALWRAAGKSGDPRGVRIRVTKRIPSRAGLGGGSSDAAAALAGLCRVWRFRLTLADLMPVAATLGSDVPFFLVGGTALGLGRGERLYPLANLPRRHVVMVLPDFGVSTPDAYRWLAEDRASQARTADPPDPAPWTLRPGRLAKRPRGPGRAAPPRDRRHPAAPGCGRRGSGPDVGQRIGRLRPVFERVGGSSRGCRPGAGRATGWCGPGRARETWSKVAGWPEPPPRAACRLRRRSSTIKVLHGRGWTAPAVSFSL